MVKLTEGSVELKVPVNAEYVSVVRLLVSGLGTRLGLAVDEISKLKLVAGEAFETVVANCGQTAGLVMLKWAETETHITISLFDPAGKRRKVISAASIALVQTLGGEYQDHVVDGVNRLDIGFEIKHRESRPYIFHDSGDGQA